MKILELFGGIGACSKAIERLGIDYEIADYVEIDKYAVKSFNAIHGTDFIPQDIREWNKDIKVDLIMHGSPCQDFSVAGKGAGGDEGSGTRSSLMYETIRIVNKLKPKYVIWENVKNLLSKKHIHNFNNYLHTMNGLGYNSYYQVLNSKDYGIPQNRERVFTISIRQDIDNGTFQFPKPFELKLKLKDMLENEVDEKYYLSDKMLKYITSKDDKYKVNENSLMINRDIACTKSTREGSTRADSTDYICSDLPENYNLKIFDSRSLKEKLCDELIEQDKVKENDVIRHSYSSSRLKEWEKRNVEINNMSPTLDTRSDCLGIVVKNNTKKGYLIAKEGDGIYTNTSTKRGTVQKQITPALTSFQDKGVVIKTIGNYSPSGHDASRIVDNSGLAPTVKENHGTVTATNYDLRIRKLTPKECWRLMGFDDSDFDKAAKVNSNAQLYKQAGNSIVVNILERILENLLLKDENDFEGQISFDMLGD